MDPQTGSWKKETFPTDIRYEMVGSAIASSKDIGYVYGNIRVGGKAGNYLRIWQKQKKSGWRIAVEVLAY